MTDQNARSYEDVIGRYESGQAARDEAEQAEFDHLAACADEPDEPGEMEADVGEWSQPDPAEVERYDVLMEARGAQETARQQELAAAEERRQAMLAHDGARTAEATGNWLAARREHQDLRLRYVSLAEQQRGQCADREAGS